MLSKEKINELYFEALQNLKFFEDIDEQYDEYLRGCIDTFEKILELDNDSYNDL